jgi:1,4-dihydroxy-6-naphthoate synthase
MHLTLGHSPDPDDAFMFYALAKDKVAMGGHTFTHVLQDIQTLNERALRGELEITAFSMHAYAFFTEQYALTPCGASMGDNYGPRLVALKHYAKEDLKRVRLAIPGVKTSAALALMLYLEKPLSELQIVVTPFDEIFAAVKEGRADVGLLIHEGQLTYAREGFTLLADLGVWWYEVTGGLPLPLGGNGIRRDLGPALHRELNQILKASIAYGLDPQHRREAVAYSLDFGRGLDLGLADEFVGMYVNELTLDYGERGRAGIREFLGRACTLGFVPPKIKIEFVE